MAIAIALPLVAYAAVMRHAILILGGALVVGITGGLLLPHGDAAPVRMAAGKDWTPRNTITPERIVSAEEVDRQQPSTGFAKPTGQDAAPVAPAAIAGAYRTCREAWAAGAAPIYRGQPSYSPHMDGDGDGIACEPYRR